MSRGAQAIAVLGRVEDTADRRSVEERAWRSVPHLARTLAVRPEVYAAWRSLHLAVRASMPLRRWEVASASAGAALGRGLAGDGSLPGGKRQEDAVAPVIAGDRSGTEDAAVAAFARRLVRHPGEPTGEDLAPLRACGLDDAAILSVIAAVGARCFLTIVLDATGTPPDAELADQAPALLEALAGGRPIGRAS